MSRLLPAAARGRIEMVAIGASAGGVEALLALLGDLPAGFGPALVVVLHLPEGRHSRLAELFGNRCRLPAREAADKEAIAPSTLYFAPPSYHLSIETDRTFSLSCEEPVHFSRPSIDVLMDSAADTYGARLAGIVLTGANMDGAAGLAKIKRLGGLTVVQKPAEALAAVMPQAAIDRCPPDLILNLKDIRSVLLEMGATNAER